MAINLKKATEELISYTIVTDKQSLVNLLNRYGVAIQSNPTDAQVTTAVLVANKRSKGFRNDLSQLLTTKFDKAGEKFQSIVGNSQDFGFTGVDDVTYMKGFTGWDDFETFTGVDDFVGTDGTRREKRQQRRFERKDARALKQAQKEESKSIKKQQQALAKGLGSVGISTPPVGGTKGKSKVGSALSDVWNFAKTKVLTSDNVNAGIQLGLNKINADSLSRQNALEQQSLLLQQQQEEIKAKQGVGVGISGNTILYIVVGGIALVGIGYLIFRQSKK